MTVPSRNDMQLAVMRSAALRGMKLRKQKISVVKRIVHLASILFIKILTIKRLARLVVILGAVWLVHAFCVAAHFTDGLTLVLCGLAAAGAYADLTA